MDLLEPSSTSSSLYDPGWQKLCCLEGWWSHPQGKEHEEALTSAWTIPPGSAPHHFCSYFFDHMAASHVAMHVFQAWERVILPGAQK